MEIQSYNYKGYEIQHRIDVPSHCSLIHKDGELIKCIAGDIFADGSHNAIIKAKEYIDTNLCKIEREDAVLVFFKELNQFKVVTMRFFDRYLHAGLITHTSHYGWFCK